MKYICECGKEFTNSQSFNGHKSHCEVHQLNKWGSLDKMINAHHNNAKVGRDAKKRKSEQSKETALNIWISEQHTCEKCGKVMTEYYGSGRFCSRSCANSRVQTDEINNKRSETIKKLPEFKSKPKIISKEFYLMYPHHCSVCGDIIEFERKHLPTCKKCSDELKHTRNLNGGLNSSRVQSETRRSKNEIYFCELCESYFNNVKHNESIFNGWDADVIIEDHKIAVLWNGKWHYEQISKTQSLKQVQNRDDIKIKEIINCGYTPYIIKDMGGYDREFVEHQFDLLINQIG